MTEPQRHDWQRIVAEIKAAYVVRHGKVLSSHKLGLMVGLDHSSIVHLERNSDAQPKHWNGERLLELHRELSRVSPLSDSDNEAITRV